MPKLYLLRHAEAASSFGTGDKERPLTSHGMNQAEKTAPFLNNIDLAICSAATRTQMTLEATLKAGALIKNKIILDQLYNASAEIIFDAIRDNGQENILIVAHNPGIHQLAASLAKEGNTEQLDQIMVRYPPASLSIFDCDIPAWGELKLYQNKLINFMTQD